MAHSPPRPQEAGHPAFQGGCLAERATWRVGAHAATLAGLAEACWRLSASAGSAADQLHVRTASGDGADQEVHLNKPAPVPLAGAEDDQQLSSSSASAGSRRRVTARCSAPSAVDASGAKAQRDPRIASGRGRKEPGDRRSAPPPPGRPGIRAQPVPGWRSWTDPGASPQMARNEGRHHHQARR